MGSPIVSGLMNSVQKLWPFQAVQSAGQLGGAMQQHVEPLLQKMGLMAKPETGWHDQMVQQANQSFQPDTSWHDQMVQRANQSFQPPAQPAPSLSTMRKPLKDK